MIILVLLPQVLSAWIIKTPNTTNYTIENNETTLTQPAREEKVYQFFSGEGQVFSLDLKVRANGGKDSYSDQNLHQFEKVTNEGDEGCYAYQQNAEKLDSLTVDLRTLISDPFQQFTDLVPHIENQQIYIIRNDLTIFQISYGSQFGLTNNTYSYSNLFNGTNETQFVQHPIAFQAKGITYIVQDLGGVSFDPLTLEIKKEGFKEYNNVMDVYYSNSLIYLAVGFDGVDIYGIDEDGIIKLNGNLSITYTSIIGISGDEDQQLLYLLDKELGLLFYDLQKNRIIMRIEISNCRHFSHYQNTFFVVAMTIHNNDYALEIFVDLKKQEYYINTIYIDELTIKDVAVFERYAVLIGEDAHKIVFHSIYNGFINQDLQSHMYFGEPNLLKIEEYGMNNNPYSNIRLMAGLGTYELKLFKIALNYPSVKCKFNSQVNQEYLLQMNSTSCYKKFKNQDYSPYSYCYITQRFNFITTQTALNYYYYEGLKWAIWILAILIILLAIGLVWLIRKRRVIQRFSQWIRERSRPIMPMSQSQENEMTNVL